MLQRHARVHIFCEGIVSVYTKFGEERFIIQHCVNEKPWQRYQSPNLTCVFVVFQFLTLENVPGQEIRHYLCAAYKNLYTVTKSNSQSLG